MSPVCSQESVFSQGSKTLHQCKCAFSSEINAIYEYYFNAKLIKRQPRSQQQREELPLSKFIQLTTLSCLVTEFRAALGFVKTSKPMPNSLSHLPALTQGFKRMH